MWRQVAVFRRHPDAACAGGEISCLDSFLRARDVATLSRHLRAEAAGDVAERGPQVSGGQTLQELQASVASGQFNIVLADFAQLAQVQQQFESSPSRVVIIPVAYKLTKAEAKDAAKQCRFLINAPGRSAQYLATIAEAVRSGSSIPRKG